MRSSVVMIAVAASIAAGCPQAEDTPAGQRAIGRRGDPKLTHSWSMPPEASVVQNGDLGTSPENVAETLMKDAAMPAVVHDVAQRCAGEGALAGVASIAIRFHLGQDGKIADVTADPDGKAAQCMTTAFIERTSALDKLPAGDALLRIRLHPQA